MKRVQRFSAVHRDQAPPNTSAQAWSWLGSALLVASACATAACSDDNAPPPVTMDPGGKPSPTKDWLLCQCSGCSLNGVGSADQVVPSCIDQDCGSSADFSAICAQVCLRWGFDTCTSATPVADGCMVDACASCLDQACPEGSCFAEANVCQRTCTTDGVEPCSRCEVCDASDQTCTLPPEGNQCVLPPASGAPAPSPTRPASRALPATFNYLNQLYGRLSIALDETASQFSFSHPDVHGSTHVQGARLDIIARNCPGAGCDLRLSDFSTGAADFTAVVEGADDESVTGVQIFMQQPAGLAPVGAAGFVLPRFGMQLLMGYSARGRHLIDAKNSADTQGELDFATGAFHLSSSFPSAGATIGLELKGSVSNYPPSANAGADFSVECTGFDGATAQLDGSGSTDRAPGPSIANYLWFQGLDRQTGAGLSLATGATPSVLLAKGPHALTLVAQDGSGALDLDDVLVDVVDRTAPLAQCTGATLECTGPLTPVTTTTCTGSDTCDPSITLASNVEAAYSVGRHSFTCSAVDHDDNLGAASCDVVVLDTTPPVITPATHTEISVCHDDPQVLAVPLPTVADLCGTASVVGELVAVSGRRLTTPVALPADGRLLLPVAPFTVRWTTVDDKGNQASVEQAFGVGVQSSAACCAAGQTLLEGTAQPDNIKPKTPGSFCVLAGAGKDVVDTDDGDDSLFGDAGDDVLSSGEGQDWVFGGSGSDVINGRKGGRMVAHGGADNDVIHANSSDSAELWAGLGDDALLGSNGNDVIYPGAGRDVVQARGGDDTVTLFDACEAVKGKVLDGGPGSDTLVTPLSLPELVSRGVVVHGFETVVIDRSKQYLAGCF